METITKIDYEKAVTMTGFGKFNLYALLICCCNIIAMIFEVNSLTFLVPASSCEFHLETSRQDVITSLPMTGILMVSHLWGYLSDTKGRRKVLVVAMISSCVFSTLSAFSPHWLVLSIFKFISCALIGCGFAISQILLAECTPIARRSVFVILSTSVFLVAYGIMAVISASVLPLSFSLHVPLLNIQFNSWRLLSLIFTVPIAISAVVVTLALESPKQLLSEDKEEEAIAILRRMYEINTGKSGDSYQVEALVLNEGRLKEAPANWFKSVLARTAPLTQKPLSRYTFPLFGLLTVCFVCLMLFKMWPFYLANVFRTSFAANNTNLTICGMIRLYQNTSSVEVIAGDCAVNSVTMISIFGVSMVLGILNVVTSGLVNYLGRKYIVIGIQVISGIALLLINFSSNWVLTMIMFVFYLFGTLNFGILQSYSIDIYPTYFRTIAICLLLLMGSSPAKLIIQLVEMLLDNHCEIMFYLFGAIACLGALVGIFLPTDDSILEITKREESSEPEEERVKKTQL